MKIYHLANRQKAAEYAAMQIRGQGMLDQNGVLSISSIEGQRLTKGELVSRLNQDTYYRDMFRSVFGERPSLSNVAGALASFERTIVSSGSRFDLRQGRQERPPRRTKKNDFGSVHWKGALRPLPQRPNFSDDKFHNIGNGTAGDDGRFRVTQVEGRLGSFQNPPDCATWRRIPPACTTAAYPRCCR